MKNVSYKSLFQFGLLIAYPWFLFIIIGFFSIPHRLNFLKESIAFGLLTGLVFSIIILFPIKKIRYYLFLIFAFLLAFIVALKLSFYYHYQVKLSASALFLIFETNNVEAKDFLAFYFNYAVIIIFILALLPVFIIAFSNYLQKSVKKLLNNQTVNPVVIGLTLLFCVFAVFQINKRFRPYNLILTYVDSYQEYIVIKELLKENISQPKSKYLEVEKNVIEPQTHVIVIGESTSKKHMQLYGYSRETNPKLTEIENELLVFDSVITPNVHTILALDKILTLSNNKTPHKEENASIVQLANQSGYTTYWLSNQRPVGMFDALATQIGTASNYTHFLATDNYSAINYDAVLLPKLKEILNDSHDKRIIFMHLAGTHIDYTKRYPKNFNYFSEENTTKTKKQNIHINAYDNAIRYNDYIIREIIETLREANTKSYMLYFSDHGDEVFDTIDFVGHNGYHNTPAMYQIPFVLWFSNSFNIPENITLDTKRTYDLENFFHSFSNLTKLSFKGLDSTKSIFSKYYIKTPLLIKDKTYYE